MILTRSLDTGPDLLIARARRSVACEIGTRISKAAFRCAAKLTVLLGPLVFAHPVEWVACTLATPAPTQVPIETNRRWGVIACDGCPNTGPLDTAVTESAEVGIVT